MVQKQYRLRYTFLSLVAPVLCTRLAFQVIQRDVFYGPDRGEKLREILHARSDTIIKKGKVSHHHHPGGPSMKNCCAMSRPV